MVIDDADDLVDVGRCSCRMHAVGIAGLSLQLRRLVGWTALIPSSLVDVDDIDGVGARQRQRQLDALVHLCFFPRNIN